MNAIAKQFSRIETIDLLRGIVLILMLLDHARMFFSSVQHPLSLTDSTPAVFFTRWISHFCAVLFVFLAGMSAYLSGQRPNQSIKQTSSFLLTRGLWFILMEFTIVFFAWTFLNVDYFIYMQVFSAIGFSMVCLSALILLPIRVVGLISILLIFSHNLLDSIPASFFGENSWLWMVLHEKGNFTIEGITDVRVVYPLIPWMGVMGLGYFMGQLFTFSEHKKRQYFLAAGLTFTLLFIVLRYVNIYGDPLPWEVQETGILTLMSFLNTHKYPPSLLFLLMTLGPGLIFLSVVPEKWCGNKFNQFIITFGKVPFFFYVAHVVLCLAAGLAMVFLKEGPHATVDYYFGNSFQYGFDNIAITYLMTFILLMLLYYPSRWFGELKVKHKKWYFKYL